MENSIQRSTEPLVRHRDFRLFGAMNPASDIGKRNLPINIRNRFTEIFVEELDNEEDLSILVREYLHSLSHVNADLVRAVVQFYLGLKDETFLKCLSNGTGVSPTYSLRTLCRALKNASNNFCNNTIVSVYDGICLSFLTDLNRESSAFLEEHIKSILFKSSKSNAVAKILRKKPKAQLLDNLAEKLDFVSIEDYWILKGKNEIPDEVTLSSSYIFTKSIKENLKRLVRVCSAQLPCLIQGDTSIGKTSLVKWLAQATGNVLIRINNHDHTDLQEYIGSYVIEPSGKLSFKEGLLAKAMRNGYWILLDELNLASSEVLEALNRVLDDNRELFIPETQEVIRAHPRFVLFATQNPPGKYAGRKQLSRAFRNRFIELHFDELPEEELLLIVEKKCKLPNSYAKLLIRTVTELKTKRSQMSGIFLGKHSLITLRDLFRWAQRFSNVQDEDCDDWKQYLAEQGLLILTSRCRSPQDVQTIHACIQTVFSKQIDINDLTNPTTLCKPIMKELEQLMQFSLTESGDAELKNFVWTASAKRTALLAGMAYKFNEPFLLVGETGIGKTTICQILALINKKHLNIINCHMHSEAADFLGSIRPVRGSAASNSNDNQLFEWQDGPLVEALRKGQDFLIDEISLADDSVLERLNSVLEEDRTLLVAENASSNSSLLVAHVNFRIFATMNPGGDFGKKELSAALRNRFTEIWCPTPTQESEEFELICREKLYIKLEDKHKSFEGTIKSICQNTICLFLRWLSKQSFFTKKSLTSGTISIRDLMRWIRFINIYSLNLELDSLLNPVIALIHGAHLVFIDALNIEEKNLLNTRNPSHECTQFLFQTLQAFVDLELQQVGPCHIEKLFHSNLLNVYNDERVFKCGPFAIEKGNVESDFSLGKHYCLSSKSTVENLQRIMRCLLMDNPIMLEGSPGVGKTSIVETLAKVTRNKVIRINLSEQTDLSELFGADLPFSEAAAAEDENNNTQKQRFCWRDGPFLLALKQGNWIILDEINLASQSVLEGLNSCFDHRGEIYITELNRKFLINKTQTKIFACQNPYIQGGGRKGLPKSFLNRFSKVYVNKMSTQDYLDILSSMFSGDGIGLETLTQMVQFNEHLNQQVLIEKQWGNTGSPWEFNLRDLFRWCDLMLKENSPQSPGNYVYLIYASRFRTIQDKLNVYKCFESVFGYSAYQQESSTIVRFAKTHLQVGQSFLSYPASSNGFHINSLGNYSLTDLNLKHLEAIIKCLEMNWMVILVGSSCVGKTSLIRMVAGLMNQSLIEFPVNNATDTSDLLGGFAKIEHEKQVLNETIQQLELFYMKLINTFLELKAKKKLNETRLTNILNEYFLFRQELKHMLDDEDFNLIESHINKLHELVKNDKHFKLLRCLLDDISSNLAFVKKRRQLPKKKMNFEWVDSSLVTAIEQGDWLLIDNANFCSPSVLDRLNPLLEHNGNLQINEKGIGLDGAIPTIKAHKNFRMILCMNESFGELSRPMRNRGVEIYLNEIDSQTHLNDQKIILKSLYSFEDAEFEYFYKQIIDMGSEGLQLKKKFNFSLILNIFKLVHDFWLVDSQTADYSAAECLRKALNEFDPPTHSDQSMRQLASIEQSLIGHHFYSEASKLKDSHLFRYLFNFPLYSTFVNQLGDYLSRLTATNEICLSNYFDLLMDAVKTTQLVEIWLRHIPVGAVAIVLQFVDATLSQLIALNKTNQRFVKEKIYNLFEKVVLKTFSLKTKTNNKFKQFVDALQSMSDSTPLDLMEETLDIKANTFMCHKLAKTHSEMIGQALHLSELIKLEVLLDLAHYRMESFYNVQDDSLFSIAKNIGTDNKEANQSSFKFLALFNEFFDSFINDVIAAMSKDSGDLNQHFEAVKSAVYLYEKFYLICACKYDHILTISYLKYYWSFLHKKLLDIQAFFIK